MPESSAFHQGLHCLGRQNIEIIHKHLSRWIISHTGGQLIHKIFCVKVGKGRISQYNVMASSANNLCKQFGPRSGPTKHIPERILER